MSDEETVRSLDNVLTRLALTQDSNLQQVLQNLIPIVIQQLKKPGTAVQNKVSEVLQILSHVNKRIEGNKQIILPLEALVDVLKEADMLDAALMKNLALVYVDIAFDNAQPASQLKVFPALIKNCGSRSPDQKYLLLRLAKSALAHYDPVEDTVFGKKSTQEQTQQSPSKKAKTDPSGESPYAEMFEFLQQETDKRSFLEFAKWTLLFQPTELLPSFVEIPQKDGRPVELPEDVMNKLKPAPPGMSLAQSKLIAGKKSCPTQTELISQKIGLLRFLKDAEIDQEVKLLLYLLAAADPVDDVNKFAENLLKKRFRIEMDSKDIDLNSSSLISHLIGLFQGSSSIPDHIQALANGNVDNFILPASLSVKSRILGVLSKSIEAANRYPNNRDIVLSCIFGTHIPMKLRQQAMEFSVWILKHASSEILAQLANPFLEELLNLLRNGDFGPQQRGYAYEAISQLAQRSPEAFSGNIEIAEDLFKALETESSGIRSQLQAAVSSLTYAFRELDPDTESAIRALLLNSIQNSQSVVRLVSITWCMRLFPFEDCFARYVCILGAGDDRTEVSVEGSLALNPKSFSKETNQIKVPSYPTLSDFVTFLLQKTDWKLKQRNKTIPLKVYATMMKFLQNCSGVVDLDLGLLGDLLDIVEGALMQGTPDSLILVSFETIVSLLEYHTESISKHYAKKMSLLHDWLSHRSSQVRDACARLIGIACISLATNELREFILSLADYLNKDSKAKFEQKDGAAKALGFISACPEDVEILNQLSEITLQNLHSMLLGLDDHLASTAGMTMGLQILNPSFLDKLKQACTQKGQSMSFSEWYKSKICEKLLVLCKNGNMAISGKAAMAVGFIGKGLLDTHPDIEEYLLTGLVSLQNIKNEELQLIIGEALALSFAKQSIPTNLILRTNFTSLREAKLDPERLQTIECGSCGIVHGQVLDSILEGLMHSRVEKRRACVEHLVALMVYCPRHPQILERLERAQKCLLGILGDKDELTQEMASRAVSLVYNLGDETTKKRLLDGLTSVLKDPSKQAKTVKVEGDTKVFEGGQLGQMPGGGNITTYKELCSLANDMGQPDLLYKFMDLANHQSALNSSRGAAVGFVHIAQLTPKEELYPLMQSIVPRLYRLKFDPNGRVQESMENIWQLLVSDSKSTITENFESILKELLTEVGSRLWRNRESSCRALSDLLQGRPWLLLAKHFNQLWKSSFRAMDDIKESVRVAGVNLNKTMKRVTLKFVDPNLKNQDVDEVLSETLPVLLETGLHSTVPEILASTFSTLSAVTSACPADSLKKYLSSLVPPLLESLSGLEHQSLNYVEQHTSAAGMDLEQLESLRISSSSQSPVGEVLSRCVRVVDSSVLQDGDLLQKLKELIQRGVGLNTRVGTLRFVSQIVIQNGSDFAPFASTLMNSILSKALNGEASSSIKKAYSQTIGTLAKYADSKTLQKLVNKCTTAFKTQEGVDKAIVGLIFKEIHSQAVDQFSIHAVEIIPVAFCARFDSKKSVAAVWSSLLDESTGSEAGAIRLYNEEIILELKSYFESSQWSVKGAAFQTVKKLYEVDSEQMKKHSRPIVELLLDPLRGRMWEGKETLLDGLGAVCKRTPEQLEGLEPTIIDAVKSALFKGNKEYKSAALSCLADTLKSFPFDSDRYVSLTTFLTETTKRQLEVELKLKTETEEASESTPKFSLSVLFRCLANINSNVTLIDSHLPLFSESIELFYNSLSNPYPWHVKKDILKSAQCMISCLKSPEIDLTEVIMKLCKGVFCCLSDQKYMELRLTSIDALKVLLQALPDKKQVPKDEIYDILQNEKNIQIRHQLETLLKNL